MGISMKKLESIPVLILLILPLIAPFTAIQISNNSVEAQIPSVQEVFSYIDYMALFNSKIIDTDRYIIALGVDTILFINKTHPKVERAIYGTRIDNTLYGLTCTDYDGNNFYCIVRIDIYLAEIRIYDSEFNNYYSFRLSPFVSMIGYNYLNTYRIDSRRAMTGFYDSEASKYYIYVGNAYYSRIELHEYYLNGTRILNSYYPISTSQWLVSIDVVGNYVYALVGDSRTPYYTVYIFNKTSLTNPIKSYTIPTPSVVFPFTYGIPILYVASKVINGRYYVAIANKLYEVTLDGVNEILTTDYPILAFSEHYLFLTTNNLANRFLQSYNLDTRELGNIISLGSARSGYAQFDMVDNITHVYLWYDADFGSNLNLAFKIFKLGFVQLLNYAVFKGTIFRENIPVIINGYEVSTEGNITSIYGVVDHIGTEGLPYTLFSWDGNLKTFAGGYNYRLVDSANLKYVAINGSYGWSPWAKDILSQYGFDPMRTIVFYNKMVLHPPPYFVNGYGITSNEYIFYLDKPVALKSLTNVNLRIDAIVGSLYHTVGKGEKMLALWLPVGGIGTGTIAGAVTGSAYLTAVSSAKLLAKIEQASWEYAQVIEVTAGKLALEGTMKGAKIVSYIGVALVVWNVVDTVIEAFKDTNLYHVVAFLPILKDSASGTIFTSVYGFVPKGFGVSIAQSDLQRVANIYGINNVYFALNEVDPSKYDAIVSKGAYNISLSDLIALTPYNIDNVEFQGILMAVLTKFEGGTTFWNWVQSYIGDILWTSGVTMLYITNVELTGLFKQSLSLSDIANYIQVETEKGVFTPTISGNSFNITLPNVKNVKFVLPQGIKIYMKSLDINTEVWIPLEVKDYYYYLDYTYYGKDMIKLKSIEFYTTNKVMKIVRKYEIPEGTIVFDATKEFEEKALANGYVYVSKPNSIIIDMANGGLMQYNKRYIFYLYFRTPPDIWIESAKFDNDITPSIIRVSLGSNVDTIATLGMKVEVFTRTEKVLEEIQKVYVPVPKVIEIPIGNYITFTLEALRRYGYVEARFTLFIEAPLEYNYDPSNDKATLSWIPTPKINETFVNNTIPIGKAKLEVYVYEHYDTKDLTKARASQGATVTVKFGDKVIASGKTDKNGYVEFKDLDTGIYVINVTKSGYRSIEKMILLDRNMTVRLDIYVNAITPPPNPVPVNESIVVLRVYNASSGGSIKFNLTLVRSLDNATLTFTNLESPVTLHLKPALYGARFSSSGFQDYETVIDATYSQAFYNIPMIPIVKPPSSYMLNVYVVYNDSYPVTGADVFIYDLQNKLIASGMTNSNGNFSILLVQGTYTVAVKYYEPLRNITFTDSKQITITKNMNITFVVPYTHYELVNNTMPKGWGIIWIEVYDKSGVEFWHGGGNITVYTTSYTWTGSYWMYKDYPIAHLELPSDGYATIPVPFGTYKVEFQYLDYRDSKLVTVDNKSFAPMVVFIVPYEQMNVTTIPIHVYVRDARNNKSIPFVVIQIDALAPHYVCEQTSYGYYCRVQDVVFTQFARTDSNGYAKIDVKAFPSKTYLVYVSHPLYIPVSEIIRPEPNSVYIYKLVPRNATLEPINGSYYVVIKAVFNDSYPVANAPISIYNATNSLVASGTTDSSGTFEVMLPSGNYTVVVTYNNTQYRFNIAVSKHGSIELSLPIASPYKEPEVAVIDARLIIHRGQSYYAGAVNHSVMYWIWTNTPQNITVQICIFQVNGTYKSCTTETKSLAKGVNEFVSWVAINQSGYMRAYVNITKYQYDTIKDNNIKYTNMVFMKPYVAVRVEISVTPIKAKVSGAIIPEDVIEVCYNVYANINLTEKMFNYTIAIRYPDLVKNVEAVSKKYIGNRSYCMNITLPWSDTIRLDAEYKYDPFYIDTIEVSTRNITLNPEVMLQGVRVLPVVFGSADITVIIKSNIRGNRSGLVAIQSMDNKTIASRNIEVKPYVEVPFSFAVTGMAKYQAVYSGVDTFSGNNIYVFTVLSMTWVEGLIALAVVGLVVYGIIRALRKRAPAPAPTPKALFKPRYFTK